MTDTAYMVKAMRRFWQKVSVNTETGCWEWRGAPITSGYGQIRLRGVGVVAHRFSYTNLVGPVPAGLELDHLCRNRLCVNPEHLEPVTRAENVRRGVSAERTRQYFASKTHCKAGHPLTGYNLIIPKDGRRRCRVCRQATNRRYLARKKEANERTSTSDG